MVKPYDYHLEQPRDYVQEDLDRHTCENALTKAGLTGAQIDAARTKAQQGWQCVVCGKGNAPHAVLCGNPVCGLDFSHAR